MKRSLKLTRPLAILDLETTGITPSLDRIVEIAILKVHPGGRKTRYCTRVNPQMAIPPEATRVHGISDRDVKNKPTFRAIGAKVAKILKGCDLAGFNVIRFDLPFLQSEFNRTNIEFTLKGRRIVDACQIYHRKEPRDLSAAYKFYCKQEHS